MRVYVPNNGNSDPHNITSIDTVHAGGMMIVHATGHCFVDAGNTVIITIEDNPNVSEAGFQRPAEITVPFSTAGMWEIPFATVRGESPPGPKTYYLNFRSRFNGFVSCTGELVATWSSATNP